MSNGYNGSTDFEKWYKQQYGTTYDKSKGLTRKEGMSDGDWDVGTILHNHYIKSAEDESARQENVTDINTRYDGMIERARAGYDTSRESLAESKNTAQQNASVVYNKMSKYLPMKAQAQGTSGLGVAQGGLEAYNGYMSQLGKISSDYSSGMRQIDEAESGHIGELENYRAESLADNDALYDSIKRSREESTDTAARTAWDKYLAADKAAKNESYLNADSFIENHVGTDAAGILSELEAKYKGKVTDSAYNELISKAQARAQYNKNTADEKAKAEATSRYNSVDAIINNYSGTNADELIGYINSHYAGNENSAEYRALIEGAKNRVSSNVSNAKKAELENAALESEKAYYDSVKADTAYSGISNYIDSDKYNSEELESFYNEVEGDLTTAQKAELSGIISEKKKFESDVERYKDNASRVGAKISKDLGTILMDIKLGFGHVNIEVGGEKISANLVNTDDPYVLKLAEKFDDKTVFGYNGAIYTKDGDAVYKLETDDSDTSAFNNVVARLNSGKKTEKTWVANGTLR